MFRVYQSGYKLKHRINNFIKNATKAPSLAIKRYVPGDWIAIRLWLRRTLVQVNGEWSMVNICTLLTIHEPNAQVSDTTGDAIKYKSR
jgi:hypothetical protein